MEQEAVLAKPEVAGGTGDKHSSSGAAQTLFKS